MPQKYSNDATTILMVSTNSANFLCPYVSKLINVGGTDHSLFFTAGIIATVVCIVELAKILANNRPRISRQTI